MPLFRPRFSLFAACGVVLVVSAVIAVWLIRDPARAIGRPVLDVSEWHQTNIQAIPGQIRAITFAISNAGTGTLRLDDLQTSCGCSPASLDRREIRAGETATLSIRFRAPFDPGEFVHSISFQSNDPVRGHATISFRGRSEWPIDFAPASVISRGTEGAKMEPVYFEVFSTSGEPVRIIKTSVSDPWISVAEDEAEVEARRKRFAVKVALDPHQQPGIRSGTIRVETDRTDRPVLLIPVRCEVMAANRVTPNRLLLKSSEAGKRHQVKFFLVTSHDRAVVSEVKSQNIDWNILGWETSISGERRIACVVELAVPQVPGYSRTQIFFHDPSGNLLDSANLSCLVQP